MQKARHTAARLQAMVQVRLIAHQEVQRRIALDPRSAPQAGDVVAHERDAMGRNWTILDLSGGAGLERTFREIVDALRLEFDLG